MAPKSASVNAITERKASAKSSKRMKQIFVGKVFSFSGDFGENWGHEQMANWIRAHGGRYEREVSDDTTHLICTVEHYMLKTVQVKMAQNLGTQCHIVVKDWLEDCLIGHAMQKRCRVETPYTLTQVLKRVGSTRDKQCEYRQKFEQGVNASNELVDNRLNHIYYDETGFEYKIVCTRVNSDGKVKSERYVIYLFESNATPCHYMAGAKLTSQGRPASFWRTECHPKIFRDAFCDFMGWFKHVTGIDWDNRLDNLPSGPNKFRYIPPEAGCPVGSLPYEKRHLLLERNGDDEKDGTVGETPSKSDSKDDAESEKSIRRSYLSCSHISKSNCRSNLGNGSQLAWR